MTPAQEAAIQAAKSRMSSNPSKLTKEQAIANAKARLVSKNPQESTLDTVGKYAKDMGVGLATGINRGAAALPGLPGSFFKFVDPSGQGFPFLPTVEDTTNAWENFAGKLPEQTTTPGKVAERIGEFIPGGAGSVPRQLATATLGGLGSSAGETMTESPWGSFIGGTLGTLLARGRAPSAVKLASKGAPTAAEVARDTTQSYDNMFKLGRHEVAASNSSARNMTARLRNSVRTIAPENAPKAFPLVAQLDNAIPKIIPAQINMGGQGQVIHVPAVHPPLALRDIEEIRKQAKVIERSPSNAISGVTDTDKHVARLITSHIDNLYKNVAPSIIPKIEAARELGQRNILSKKLIEIERKSGWTSDEAKASRGKISTWGQGAGKSMPPVVQSALNNVVKGSTTEKVLGGASLLGRGKLGNALLYGGAAALPFSPYGALAVMGFAGSHLAKTLADIAASKSISRADKVILAGRARQAAAKTQTSLIRSSRDKATVGGLLGSATTSQTYPLLGHQ